MLQVENSAEGDMSFSGVLYLIQFGFVWCFEESNQIFKFPATNFIVFAK
jgi:hypothetical protein